MILAGREWRRGTNRPRLADIRVLVIGADQLISRDVVRALKVEQALVTAAARDEQVLTRLQRDLGLYRTTVEVAAIDLASASEMRLFATNLHGQGTLPHLVICCCGGPACPLPMAMSALQPSLVLHALPRARFMLWGLARRLYVPPLAALFGARGRRPGLFDTDARPRQVRIAGHVFSLRRWEEAPARPRGRPKVAGHDHAGAERRRQRGLAERAIPYPRPQGRFHQEVP